MQHLGEWGVILTAIGPVATAVLGIFLKRSDTAKTRKLDEVVDQVKANGGATLRDAVDRIERHLGDLTARIEQLETQRMQRRWWGS